MNLINVISVGPGPDLFLTGQARQAIAECDLIYCADRLRPLTDDPAKCRNLYPFESAFTEIESNSDRRIGILLSGDAGLYSLLPVLERRFGPKRLQVIPGISSVQLLCARLGLSWQDIPILSVHGRDMKLSVLSHTVRHHRRTLFLLDGTHNPPWLAGQLAAGGLTGLLMTVGECLGGPDEVIGPLTDKAYPSLCLMLVENPAPLPMPVPGLPDSAFLRNRTPMTKQTIRIQILAALHLQPDSVVYDIGAGTGSVSIECARLCPYGHVYAFEHDPEALDILNQNIRHFHLQNITVVPGEAPRTLSVPEKPDCVFLGGTGDMAEAIVRCLRAMDKSIRLCATAVTPESIHTFLQLFAPLTDPDMIQLSVTRIEPAGHLHLYRAQNPITLFSATLNP
ncbi:MAG: precorrin-6y C5,15-methyltransferase (decarboxylating) subunit CbiE [Clostridia bacterium]|nr:precorrin-6y C5,15-methyltransferase (decarboxylating) subunit CbiE [Clostridia bacterium]